MDPQLRKVFPKTSKKTGIFRSDYTYKPGENISTPGKDHCFERADSDSKDQEGSLSPPLYEATREDGVFIRSSSLCSVSLKNAATQYSVDLEQEGSGIRLSDAPVACGASEPQLVAHTRKPAEGEILSTGYLDGGNNRCQSVRLGSSSGTGCGPRSMVQDREDLTHQHSGDPGDTSSSKSLDYQATGLSGQDPVRQCHSSGLCQSSGRHPEPSCSKRGEPDLSLGRDACAMHIGSFHPGNRELAGGLSKSPAVTSRGMVSASRRLLGHMPKMGGSRCRSLCIPIQQKDRQICGKDKRSSCMRDGCVGDSVASVLTDLRIPAYSATTTTPSQDQAGKEVGTSGGPRLAQKDLVCRNSKDDGRFPVDTTGTPRPVISRSSVPSCLTNAKFDGLAIETHVLKSRGLSGPVISTLINARKPASRMIYHRVWKAYITWCESRGWHPRKYVIGRILDFLQMGLEMKLALSTIKGQVSALSVLFQRPLASHSLVRNFMQGVMRLNPPVKAPLNPWDLNLVLAVLQKRPFEPISQIPLVLLTRKLIFLVAISSARRVSELAALSCKEPYLIIHKDRVVLRPHPSFLPKVVSDFHLNQDIVLPSFFPDPCSPEERSLHSLDVVRAVKAYLGATTQIRKTDVLFVLPEGPNRGQAASKATISKWIRQLIIQAYGLKQKIPPFQIRAHSTRDIGASWAVHHRASMAQICKAATWSSVHTFTRFYQVDVRRHEDIAFGRSVLQAAVQGPQV